MHGPFYWKSNNTSLDDQHFVTGLTEQIDYVVDNELKTIEDARIRWDILQYRIRISVNYSHKVRKLSSSQEQALIMVIEKRINPSSKTGDSTKYSKTAAEDRRKRRLQLESKVMELEARVTVESSTQFMQNYEAAASELEGIYNYITEGIIQRSRTMLYGLGEKFMKNFLTLEKRHHRKKS